MQAGQSTPRSPERGMTQNRAGSARSSEPHVRSPRIRTGGSSTMGFCGPCASIAGRSNTWSYQWRAASVVSGMGMPRARVAKSTVTRPAMSATEDASLATKSGDTVERGRESQ